MLLLARIVRIVTALVVGFIVVGIVLHLLDAHASNAVVGFIYDVAGWLVTPFKNVFSPGGAKANIAANWGRAGVVYAIVGGLLSRLLAADGPAARDRFATRLRPVACRLTWRRCGACCRLRFLPASPSPRARL